MITPGQPITHLFQADLLTFLVFQLFVHIESWPLVPGPLVNPHKVPMTCFYLSGRESLADAFGLLTTYHHGFALQGPLPVFGYLASTAHVFVFFFGTPSAGFKPRLPLELSG